MPPRHGWAIFDADHPPINPSPALLTAQIFPAQQPNITTNPIEKQHVNRLSVRLGHSAAGK